VSYEVQTDILATPCSNAAGTFHYSSLTYAYAVVELLCRYGIRSEELGDNKPSNRHLTDLKDAVVRKSLDLLKLFQDESTAIPPFSMERFAAVLNIQNAVPCSWDET